jgi:hypothetical protein
VRPLPRPLARWADELAALSQEARNLLGPWLPILERMRGSISLPHSQAEGEPDGLSGLTRRGLYERLIATEWAVLDAAPDEFVRRAAAGEHLFNELARVETAGAGRIVALFDAGPWQLGAPRLAHLAWLLVLARHARSRSIHFFWGVLQAAGEGLRDSTDTGDLRALMAARTRQTVDPAMVAAWADRLGPRGKREERWLITHARDERTASRLDAFTLAIAEAHDPLVSTLVVGATSRASLEDRAVLPLPPRRACGRLLRDPVRDQPREGLRPLQASSTIAPGAQVVFSATSPHVVARLASGEIVALLIIGGDKEQPIRRMATFSPPQGTSVVAAGWRKGRMYVVTSEGATLTLHCSRGGRWMSPKPFTERVGLSLPVSSPNVLGRLFVDNGWAKLWFCDERWRLHVLDLVNLTAGSEGDSVVAWGFLPSKGDVVFVQRAPNGPLELRAVSAFGKASLRLMDGARRVSLGYVATAGVGAEPSLVALGTGDGEWYLCSYPWTTAKRLRLSPETPVYGAARIEGRHCLLVRSSTRQKLELFDGEAPVVSLTFPDEVEHACLHPNGHWIAAQVAGGLCVVDRRGKEYLRWGGPWA